MSLSEQDREALWSGLRRAQHEDAPVPLAQDCHKAHVLWAVTPAVEQIVARHVAAALTEAADAIEESACVLDCHADAARIVRDRIAQVSR